MCCVWHYLQCACCLQTLHSLQIGEIWGIWHSEMELSRLVLALSCGTLKVGKSGVQWLRIEEEREHWDLDSSDLYFYPQTLPNFHSLPPPHPSLCLKLWSLFLPHSVSWGILLPDIVSFSSSLPLSSSCVVHFFYLSFYLVPCCRCGVSFSSSVPLLSAASLGLAQLPKPFSLTFMLLHTHKHTSHDDILFFFLPPSLLPTSDFSSLRLVSWVTSLLQQIVQTHPYTCTHTLSFTWR